MTQTITKEQNDLLTHLKYNKQIIIDNIQTLVSDIGDFNEVLKFDVDVNDSSSNNSQSITVQSENFSDLFPILTFSSVYMKNHRFHFDEESNSVILPIFYCFQNFSGENIYSKFIDLQIFGSGRVKFRSGSPTVTD
mgnify:CR=1 FL=1